MSTRSNVPAALAIAVLLLAPAGADANSTGSPCSPTATAMGATPHGQAQMSGAGGFSLEASAATISGAPVTVTFKNTNTHATFKGLYLEAHNASGTITGSFATPAGYKSLTCAGVPGAAITTSSNTIRTVGSAFTWTPPVTPTSAADSAVTITGIVIVSLGSMRAASICCRGTATTMRAAAWLRASTSTASRFRVRRACGAR